VAAGVTLKFHGSQIRVLTGFVSESPPQAITAITAADPPVVTSNAHGLDDGDIIKITGVVGPDELNDQIFVVINATINTFELADTNTSDYDDYVSGGAIAVAEMSNFCELTSYNRAGAAKPEEDVTSLCSTAKEYELGLPDFGTTSIDFKFAPETSIQEAIAAFERSGDKTAVRVILPSSGGDMIQLGFIQSTSETVAVGGVWRGSMTIRNTGYRVDVAV
jgi:hypothetical protein